MSEQTRDHDSVHSILFVPGNRPERFAKALATEASLVCLDLEDAVPPEQRDDALTNVLAFIGTCADARVAIRINGLTTRDGLRDLLALAAASSRPSTILLPKVGSPTELEIAANVLAQAPTVLLPIVETLEGLDRALEIARAPRTTGLLFGGADLSAELRVAMAWEPLAVARGLFVHACARAGVPAFDVPFIAYKDLEGLAAESDRVKALGFSGKAAIHPEQVAVINKVFRPSEIEVEEAREALAVFEAAGRRAVGFKGQMLEAPVIKRYRRIAATAAGDC